MTSLFIVAAALSGYLTGSLPTAWLVVRHVMGKDADVRIMGDTNVGATNVGRLLGAYWGTVVGIVDIFKGFAAVSAFGAAYRLTVPADYPGTISDPEMVVGAACVIGHIWPVWLRFRGGRGAATAIGVIGAIFTTPVLILTPPTALILLITRNTSIAFGIIYYWSLIIAKVFFDAAWEPVVYCYFLSYPVLLTDPRLRRYLKRFIRGIHKRRIREDRV